METSAQKNAINVQSLLKQIDEINTYQHSKFYDPT
jgi:hypothetical protein